MMAQRSALVELACLVITVFTILLFVRVLVSWAFVFGFRPPISGPWRKLLDLLDDVTDPVLRPLRAMIPPIRAGAVGIDLSIIVAFVVLAVIRTALNC